MFPHTEELKFHVHDLQEILQFLKMKIISHEKINIKKWRLTEMATMCVEEIYHYSSELHYQEQKYQKHTIELQYIQTHNSAPELK